MIYTFYSYKGGVGRTMALANVAELFYRSGLKVLMVDWDLEAPGLERFFPLDLDEVLDKPGVIDMLLGYKAQMAKSLSMPEDGEDLPFEKPDQFIVDIYPNAKSDGRLWLLPSGRRSKEHFADYAYAVRTFDWQDFYESWEGELYFEWLRQQFEQMADVVLIDSRTGVTEMGGVCVYQFADVVVMFCSANQQSLDGTQKMLLDFKRSQVQELRGHPVEAVVVPARIEDAESDYLDEFQQEFLDRFAKYTPRVLGTGSDRFWQLAIPYTPRYAYKETIAVLEKGKASAKEIVEAFNLLAFTLSRLAPDESAMRSALPETEVTIGNETIVSSVVGGDVVVGDQVVSGSFVFDLDASDADALQTYFNNVIFERHSRLSFLFIEPKTGKVYTEADVESVFVPLRLTNPEASRCAAGHKHRREIFAPLSEEMDEALSPATLPEILKTYDCLLLRGKPGCGKTTLLRHIALSFARGEHREKLEWSDQVPLPLLVPLRNFGAFLQLKNREGAYLGPQPRALLEYLEEHLRGAGVRFSPDFLPRRLEAGQCLLLLDALDEVSGELDNGGDLRAAVARQAAAFIRRYHRHGNRFILTSRPHGYQDDGAMRRALPQPQVCDVLDLDRAGYHQLIVNLLTVLTGDVEAGQAEAVDLVKRVARNPQLADLAANPLLCTTLVLVYKYYGRRLPERRVDVLDEVVTLLLGRWEEERRYVFSPDELVTLGTTARTTERAIEFRRRALVALAWQMQQAAEAEIAGRAATKVLAQFYCEEERATEAEARRWAEDFLDIAHERSGLFIAVDEGLHTFAHQAFREYFAATHLVNAGEVRLQEEVLRHAPEPDDWWRQVVLLTGAHPQLSAGAAGRLVEMLLGKGDLAHAELAARFAQHMTDKLPGPQRTHLQERLWDVMRDPQRPAKERVRAGRALALAGDPRCGVGLRDDDLPDIAWREVPAGPFPMGSADEDRMALSDEKPQHEYEIEAPYRISRYPVTNAQYAVFAQAGGYREERYWTEAAREETWREGKVKAWQDDEPREGAYDYGEPFNLPNHPVVGVSWYEAVAFCRWLTEQLRQQGELGPDEEISLPTEPQWEKTARGTDGRIYPWGQDTDPERANYGDTGVGTPNAVGCFPGGASPYGVSDIVGNVWEWCSNSHHSYPYDSANARGDTENSIKHVVRGGSYQETFEAIRCSSRHQLSADHRASDVGFRIVVLTKQDIAQSDIEG